MKNRPFFLLLAWLAATPARAAETLSFTAEVQDDALAEEAILLVHCLADRAHLPWEFNGSTRGAHWLKLREKEQRLVGTYKNGGAEKPVSLAAGGVDEACAALEPSASPEEPHLSAGLSPNGLGAPALEPLEAESPEGGAKKTWLWVGLGAAALVGGFFLLRPHHPDHSGIAME